MKNFLLTLLAILLLAQGYSQSSGHNIIIKLEGYTDTLAYLGHYFGDKLSVSDTADALKGDIHFQGDESLKQGVYFLASEKKKKLFEFMVDEQQEFMLKMDLNGSPTDMEIEGSEENILFYSYLKQNKSNYERIQGLQSALQRLPEGSDSTAIIKNRIDSINNASIAYKLNLIDENPDALTTLLFNIMREPEIPEFFLEDGRHDSLSTYLYYRNHYWDGIDFSDDRILRTPVFHRKLDRYMKHVIPKQPDTVITEIDQMVSLTKENAEMKEYLLWYFTNSYETSKIMGHDRIFVHMVDKYFTDHTYDWLNPTVQQNLIKRVSTMRKVLIGEYAPGLIMADTNNEFIALQQIDADYVIVLFWSSTCGECKREVNSLKKFYEETELDLEIYAVNTDTVFSDWKNYVIEKDPGWVQVNGNLSLTGDYHDLYDIYSTPVIYILNREKKIIAKRLAAEKIPEFLFMHKKNEYD
ncbi:MAG: thioredoxin-like domain-containing protein [Bacteroidota bacterium]